MGINRGALGAAIDRIALGAVLSTEVAASKNPDTTVLPLSEGARMVMRGMLGVGGGGRPLAAQGRFRNMTFEDRTVGNGNKPCPGGCGRTSAGNKPTCKGCTDACELALRGRVK